MDTVLSIAAITLVLMGGFFLHQRESVAWLYLGIAFLLTFIIFNT